MLVENSRPPGSMSLDPRNRPKPPKPPVPEWISSASSREVTLARGRAAESVPLEGPATLAERCELCEQAQSLIETIGSRDRRKLAEAITKRDGITIPEPYTFTGHKPRPPRPRGGDDRAIAQCRQELLAKHDAAKRALHKATVEVEALAHQLAARAVKVAGPLRDATEYLLAHPIPIED